MMRQHKLVRAVLGGWAIVLAVSVVPVHGAGNSGEQSNLEPNGSPGHCDGCYQN